MVSLVRERTRTQLQATWTGLGLWLGWLAVGTTARAEDKPPVLVGYVKKLVPDRDGGDREVGVEKVQIAMKGTGNWVGSDAHGQFRVQLLRSVRIGQSIEVEVEGMPGWLLYQPADGRVVVPEAPQTVTLKLLPKGSLRFLGSQGLASLLTRMMSEAKDSARSSPVVPLGSVPPPVDLKGPMQKWASEYGLSLEQVQTAVDKWAKDVLSRRQQDDEQVCLAHYSQKQLEQAARCFDELGQKDVQELERLKAQVLERTERAVRRFVKAADAHNLRYDFAAALAEYEKAARWAKRDVSPALWAEVQNLLGIAHQELGIRVEGESAQVHLAQAVTAYRLALEVYTKKDLPQDWAMTQNNLGTALSDQASRTQGTEGTALLAQAVTAYRLALEVYTKKDLPQDWAMTQNNLGIALSDQASRTQGTEGTALLAQAVTAYRLALEVYTKKDLPQDWARTQNNLGAALSDQASRTQGTEGTALLAQAVTAYRLALEVYTKKDLPQDWAMTQNNLGTALSDQASRTQGTEGTALLAQAVTAYRLALEVYTKKDLPQDWAMTQNNLGIALSDQASRLPVDSPARKALLTQSIASFRAALEIHTQSVFPIQWARAQTNLARSCALVPDERCAADSFASVLRVYPDWGEGYGEAYVRYHEKLFLVAEAYALNRAWLDHHPDDLAVWSNYIESHLTTGRLAEVSGLLAKVFAKLAPAEQVPLLAIEVFALVGQGNPVEAASKSKALRTLIDAQPAAFRVNWTFGGTRHFLQTDPRFAPHRAQLLALLSALEQPNRAAILAALDVCCSNAAQKP
jgi:tetratricopeptide (TPR) repeat protein